MGVFLYDGDCRLCERSARWLERHAAGTARVESWQHADLAPLGLSPVDCAEGLQWVDDGHRLVGPEAVAAYLGTSTDPWRTAGRVLTTPVSRRVAWPVYRWVAHHHDRPSSVALTGAPDRAAEPMKGIRRRKARDLAGCTNLLALVFSDGQYPVHWPEAPRAWLDGEDVIDAWVLERHGELLGHVAISRVGLDSLSALRWRELTGHEPSDLAGVSRLFVRPRARGNGIGTALLDVAVDGIRGRGLVPVAEVVSRSTDAIKLYEDLGWRLRAAYPWGEKDGLLQTCYYAAPPEPVRGAR